MSRSVRFGLTVPQFPFPVASFTKGAPPPWTPALAGGFSLRVVWYRAVIKQPVEIDRRKRLERRVGFVGLRLVVVVVWRKEGGAIE